MQSKMSDDSRVVTAKLPGKLVLELDKIAERMERSKSWIIRQALIEWLAEEQRRHELTLEALSDVDEGRTVRHEDVLAEFEQDGRNRHRSAIAEK